MIYLTYRNCSITESSTVNAAWESEHEDLKWRYKAFLLAEAIDRGITINPHWYNIMNRDNHHSNLTIQEYKLKEIEWRKFMKDNSFEAYIEREGLAVKIKHENIY